MFTLSKSFYLNPGIQENVLLISRNHQKYFYQYTVATLPAKNWLWWPCSLMHARHKSGTLSHPSLSLDWLCSIIYQRLFYEMRWEISNRVSQTYQVDFILLLVSKASVSRCLGQQSCHRHGPKTVPAQTAEITKCHSHCFLQISNKKCW